MARKIAFGLFKLLLGGPAARRARKCCGDGDTVISPIDEIRKSGPFKDCEGPQIYDIKGPNDPCQFLLTLTPESGFRVYSL